MDYYCLSLKHKACHALKHDIPERSHGYFPCHINKSDTGYMRLEQQYKKEKNKK